MLTGFDFIIISIVLASSIFSMFKGFVSEFTSIVSLIVASLLTYCVGKDLSPFILKYIQIEFVVYILSYGIVFLVSLFATYILMHTILGACCIKTGLNQLLGFFLGLIKSIIIVGLALLVLDFFIPYGDQSQAIQSSYFKNLVLKEFKLDSLNINNIVKSQ